MSARPAAVTCGRDIGDAISLPGDRPGLTITRRPHRHRIALWVVIGLYSIPVRGVRSSADGSGSRGCWSHAGSEVERIDALRLLAGCRKSRKPIEPGSVCPLSLSLSLSLSLAFSFLAYVLLFSRATFCVTLVAVCKCSVFWLFC